MQKPITSFLIAALLLGSISNAKAEDKKIDIITAPPVGNIMTSDINTKPDEVKLDSKLIIKSRLKDNQTLVISGIISETDKTTVTKVPILGDIPLLGVLFRSSSVDNERQEVIILLTPKILKDSES